MRRPRHVSPARASRLVTIEQSLFGIDAGKLRMIYSAIGIDVVE
jgi:hypothetical protein